MTYEDPACAYCPSKVRACRTGDSETRGPGFCPTHVDADALGAARAKYVDDAEIQRISVASALVEAEGYCRWTRVEEIVEFSKRMAYRKIGIANCISFVDHARVLSGILESHGFEVASVACKSGNIPKEEIGLTDAQKIRPGGFEPLCNPVAQAGLLNAHGCELNIVMGLCVGHDSLFIKESQGLVTVLVTKDRVLAHNPIGALHLADTYYSRVYGPDRPAEPPKLPKAGRKPAPAAVD